MFNLNQSDHHERNGEIVNMLYRPAHLWRAKMLEIVKDSCCSIRYSLRDFLVAGVALCIVKLRKIGYLTQEVT